MPTALRKEFTVPLGPFDKFPAGQRRVLRGTLTEGRLSCMDENYFTANVAVATFLNFFTFGQVWDGKTTVARFYIGRQATKGKRAGVFIVLYPDAAKAITRWIKAGGFAANPQGYLFPSQKYAGRGLGRKSAWAILHPAFQQAGVCPADMSLRQYQRGTIFRKL